MLGFGLYFVVKYGANLGSMVQTTWVGAVGFPVLMHLNLGSTGLGGWYLISHSEPYSHVQIVREVK